MVESAQMPSAISASPREKFLLFCFVASLEGVGAA